MWVLTSMSWGLKKNIAITNQNKQHSSIFFSNPQLLVKKTMKSYVSWEVKKIICRIVECIVAAQKVSPKIILRFLKIMPVSKWFYKLFFNAYMFYCKNRLIVQLVIINLFMYIYCTHNTYHILTYLNWLQISYSRRFKKTNSAYDKTEKWTCQSQ